MSESIQDDVLDRAVAALERGAAGRADFERLRSEHPTHVGSLDELAQIYGDLGDGAPPRSPADYELRERIGEGGIGLVYRAFDKRLGRDVALKFLRPEYRGLAKSVARFEREACVSGRLQHPAVVPVYELVRSADGPCLAMKLIEGRSLAEILSERSDCSENLAEVVEVFAGVCQAIAYAHRHGVVHRDVKPHNVMVGAFGEVQVVDWGFAKLLDGGDETAVYDACDRVHGSPAVDETERSNDELLRSRVGSAFGSPPYMPQEQARGDIGSMDERVDVFALGGILCEILTGLPPYTVGERPGTDVLDRARDADIGPALDRLRSERSDPGLAAIASRCLSSERDQRPRNAGVVAELVAEHSRAAADRARNAELAAATERGRAERERQARRLTTALAVAGLLLILGCIAFFSWRAQQRSAREERVARLARTELSALDTAMGQARSALTLGSDQRALEWVDDGYAHAEQIELLLEAESVDWSTALATQASERIRAFEAERATAIALLDQRAREARFLGLLRGARVPSHERADWVTKSQSSLQRRIDRLSVEAFDAFGVDPLQSANAAEFKASLLVESHAPVAVALDVWAAARFGEGLEHWSRLLDLADALDPAAIRSELRRLARATALDREAWQGLCDSIPLVDHEPQTAVASVAWLLALGVTPAAAEPMLDALRVRHPDSFDLVIAYALSLEWTEQPRLEDAVRAYRVAKAIRPDVLEVRHRLGFSLEELGRHEEAGAEWRELARIDPENGHWHYHVGLSYARLAQPEESALAFESAVHHAPDDPYSWGNLGIQRRALGRIEAAKVALRRAIEVKSDFATPYYWLGLILSQEGDDAGLAELERVSDIDSTERKPNLDTALALSSMYRVARRWDDALRVARVAVEIGPRSVPAFVELCRVHLGRGDLEAAAESAAVVASSYQSAKTPKFDDSVMFASVFRRTGRIASAVRFAELAVRDLPSHFGGYVELCLALTAVGRFDEAVQAGQSAVDKGGARLALAGLATALERAGRSDEAIVCVDKALVAANPPGKTSRQDWSLHFQKARVFHALGRLEKAAEAYSRSIEHRPDFAEAWCNRGLVLLELERSEEALECLRRGHELGTARGESWRYPSAQWLREAEEAVARK